MRDPYGSGSPAVILILLPVSLTGKIALQDLTLA